MNVNRGTEIKPSLPPGWRRVKLGEVCRINPKRPALIRDDNTPTAFIPMSAIDDIEGIVIKSEARPYAEIKKGYTYFGEGDVLFAKITPCMQNGKQAIARGLIDQIGFGSTEFHVIRPGPAIRSEWIHFFVRQPQVLSDARAHFTGAVGQQRVPKDYLANLDLSLPPLSEQKRIAAILDKQIAAVEKARAAAEAQLEAAKALNAAYLRQVFPKEGRELPRGWRWMRLGDVFEIKANLVDPRASEFSGMPHVGAEDIESGTGRLYKVQSAAEDGMMSGKYLFESGCVLYSKIRPYLRKVALAPFRGLCSADMYPLEINGEMAISQFVVQLLLSQAFTEYADAESRRARMPKLNRKQLFSYVAPIPPLSDQMRIAAKLDEQMASAEQLRNDLEKQLREINALPEALLGRAFRGEL